MIPASAEE